MVTMGKGFVAVDKATLKAVAEFQNPGMERHINKEKYRCVPILEYLQSLNETR